MIQFEELSEYRKDFKKLVKKYQTLHDDIAILKKILSIKPEERPPFSFQVAGTGVEAYVIIVKKIACKSLKGKGVNSGLRLVYAYCQEEHTIIFIELFHKNEKEHLDQDRITRNFK
ncbi:MAG: hypothetical protein WCY79_05740 [Bacteroidales bacterium]|jgi:mRNA-degrading endonuclease YafQ of YafQ-DinJ toxin-antitoxin module